MDEIFIKAKFHKRQYFLRVWQYLYISEIIYENGCEVLGEIFANN